MNLYDIDKEVSLDKTIRVLVYPNITFAKDLEKDSYVQVMKNMIRELQDKPIFWTILSPEHIDGLDFPNTEQLMWELPTYPPAMRSHFDVTKFKKLMGHDRDFDLVMSHLPEHTHQLVNTLYNLTHHTPKVIGYAHWFDFDHVCVWAKDSFKQNICGLLEMEKCYINTQTQKNMVLEQARDHFNLQTIHQLDEILTVQYLGVMEEDIVRDMSVNIDNTIVFNHRPDAYKHYKEFIQLMDLLWEERQDFKVWVPLLGGKPDRPYLTNEKFDKEGYYDKLKECCVGFSPKQKYGGWSVATTDGMMNGCPYIMYDGEYYHELFDGADFFTTDQEALDLLNIYLDEPEHRMKKSYDAINHLRLNLLYKDNMEQMYKDFIEIIESTKPTLSDKTNELIEVIKQKGSITKKELFNEHCGWGRGIKFTPYRRGLLEHPNIFDVMDKMPTYNWK
tara:strand:+ start:1648 stop:2985 length:1338 start_codon:yes stop_codon:yes gene_type:complete